MTRRLGLLAAAVLVALLGTTAVFSYVSKVESTATAGAEMVDVLVAAARIPAGTTAEAASSAQLIQVSSMPRKSIPEGALASLDTLGTDTTVSDVFAGEVLLRAKFAPRATQTGALTIPKGKIGMSVQLGDPQRVAGFVVPGSEVAVFVTVEQAPASAGAQAGQYTSLLLPRASVIAVGPSTLEQPAATDAAPAGAPPPGTAPANTEAVPTAILTLALNQVEAERLIHAASTGALYFGLLSTSSVTAPGPGVSNSTLLQ